MQSKFWGIEISIEWASRVITQGLSMKKLGILEALREAPVDPPPAHRQGLASPGGTDPTPAPAIPTATGGADHPGRNRAGRCRRLGRRL